MPANVVQKYADNLGISERSSRSGTRCCDTGPIATRVFFQATFVEARKRQRGGIMGPGSAAVQLNRQLRPNVSAYILDWMLTGVSTKL